MSFSVIGKPTPREDALFKVTGSLRYLDDLVLPGMLWGRLVRSPYPHARVVSIDAAAALALPGVKAVITAADLPPRRLGFHFDNRPLHDKVSCVGDPVAAVAAVDEEAARAAAELVAVHYEPLPGVFDPEAALAPDAPLVHAEQWFDAAGQRIERRKDNVAMHYRFQHGDPEAALAACDAVVEARFTVPFVTTCTIEPQCAIAAWDAAGNLTLWSPTQAPHLFHKEMAEALGISGKRIRVIGTPIGGAFGKNLEAHAWEVANAVLARKAGRPVKLVFSRQEEFIGSRPRQPHIMYVKAGATKDGKLQVRTCEAVLDNGAYNAWGALTPLVTMQSFTSMYRVPNSRYEAKVVYTNHPYAGAMRGYGNPEAVWAIEQTMDMLADKLGLDPLAFRLNNVNQPDETTPQGMKITACLFDRCLSEAAARIDYSAKRGRQREQLRGVGLAGVLHVGGGARIYRSDGCGMIVKLDDFGKVTVLCGASDSGAGAHNMVAMVVAEELGVLPDDVRIVFGDTALVPWDVGVHATRTTFVAGNAARVAAANCKQQLLAAAAEQLGVPAAALDVRERSVFVRAQPAQRIAYDKVIRALHFKEQGNVIIGHAYYDPPTQMQDQNWQGNISATYLFGAHAAEVEIDPETGRVQVLKVVAVHDVGQVINPQAVEGQIDGGVLLGIGYALQEEMKLEQGQVINATLREYGFPTSLDAVPVEKVILEGGDPLGPFGAKGIGEPATVPTAAAIANAVADALGVRLTGAPLTPEKVLAALQQRAAVGRTS